MRNLLKVLFVFTCLVPTFAYTANGQDVNQRQFKYHFRTHGQKTAAYDNQVSMRLAYNEGGKVFIFSPRSLSWQAYANGHLIRSGHASGGSGYCRDIHRSCHTPVGSFRVIEKGGAGCKSTRYPLPHGGAPMPYCMFFTHYYAIHGSNQVPNYNASHGCIRVHPSDAYWLNRNFIDYGTRVIVRSY